MNKFRAFGWFTLFYCVGVILWGAYVRATGSGAGCGRHWPLCNGEVVPRAERIQTLIEYSHRLSSGLSLIFVIALVVFAFKKFPANSFQRKAAMYSFVAILLEAAVGALLVMLRLVEHDQSIDRVISISLHLVNTLFLLASISTLVWSTYEEKPRWSFKTGALGTYSKFLFFTFGILGALGAMTALGDTLFPVATSGPEKIHFLQKIRIVHPIFALFWFGALTYWTFLVSEKMPALAGRAKFFLLFALGNLFLGLLNVILKAPVSVQILHLLYAESLWILFVILLFSLSSRWR